MDHIFPQERSEKLRRDLDRKVQQLKAAQLQLQNFLQELRENEDLFEASEITVAQQELEKVQHEIVDCVGFREDFEKTEAALRAVIENRMAFFAKHEALFAQRPKMMDHYVQTQTKLIKDLTAELQGMEGTIAAYIQASAQ